MKNVLVLFILMVGANASAQPPDKAQTTSLLTWLIKTHHIHYLQPKTNDGIFYGNRYLSMKSILKPDNQTDTSQSLSNYLSNEEIVDCKTALPAKLTNWRSWYKQLPVVFTAGIKSELKLFDRQKTIYTLSNPLWLNEKATRVLIGEYFSCGIACGRGDMLLCEFKEGKWQLMARGIITND